MCSSNGTGSHGFSIVVGVVCSGGLSLPLAVLSEHVVPTQKTCNRSIGSSDDQPHSVSCKQGEVSFHEETAHVM